MSTIHVPSHELARLESEAGVELVNGQIVEKPVSIDSSEIEAIIIHLLLTEARKDGSARVFPSSMGYRCFADDPEKFRKPDVSLVRSERLRAIDPGTGFIPIPPDLAVEVLSPNDLIFDVDRKLEDYLRSGFKLVWIVHPNTRTVSIYRADGSVTVLHDSDEITGETALPTFRSPVSEFFVSLS
ncbi:MAG TPA: Uma2 family endonuclease [Tepidisphaeraceae bacterium]|nr:Uma2 family endonuclease [Tepidisphaeraceae bacterium]